MLVTERLDVSHNFVTIDSPIKFFLEINGDVKTRVLKSSQAIQIDCRKLLTKKDMPNFPAWTLSLIYDDSLLAPGEKVNWYPHDVDFAGSQDSVNGQLVDVDLSALYAELTQNNENLIDSVGTVKSSTDAVKSSTDAIKSSTDAIKSSTDAIKSSTDAVKGSVDSVFSILNVKSRFIYCHLSSYFIQAFSDVFGFSLSDVTSGWMRYELKSSMYLEIKDVHDHDKLHCLYLLPGTKIGFYRQIISVSPDIFSDQILIIGEYYYSEGESQNMEKRCGMRNFVNLSSDGLNLYWIYL